MAMVRLSFESEPLAVLEERLIALLGASPDYRYNVSRVYYPWALPGVRVPLAPPRLNNCCTFVEALRVKAFSEAHGAAFSWDARRHRQMMIASSQDYFSPVTAAVESGMALVAPSADVPPHPWTLIQGWRSQWGAGHTFLVADHHAETDKVLVLESNAAYGSTVSATVASASCATSSASILLRNGGRGTRCGRGAASARRTPSGGRRA
ncbi:MULTISPECIES: hypothetical protein [unclassified Myxococcus]|uniref:hypothetical protein n=1 Tax=unclassified Myxococcus TaxID=2648731 RepID=UPI0020C5E52E|nr:MULTISPECIES: hypothetical protein [unclassified Myxococcus]